jgi:hypothetical protein
MDLSVDLASLDHPFVEIQAMYAKDRQAMTSWEAITSILMTKPNLCWQQKLPANMVGVHPENRGGLGYVVNDALVTASKHCSSGYSYSKACEGAWSVQYFSGRGCPAQAFNNHMENQNLPPLQQLAVLSFGSSHQNVFLRSVLGRRECHIPKLAPSGRLDPSGLGQQHAGLQRALMEGLTWNVIHHEVEHRFPWIIKIGQTALNLRGVSDVSELEGMLTMVDAYHAFVKASHKENDAWDKALETAADAQAFWMSWAPAVLQLCQAVTSDQLREAIDMKRLLVKVPDGVAGSYGHLGGAFLVKLASLKWPSSVVQNPRVRMAAFMSNLLSPVDRIDDGKCVLLKDSDLTKLTSAKMQKDVKAAEDMMESARKACDESNAPTQMMLRLVCMNDARLVNCLLKKGKQSAEHRDYTTIYDAYAVFLDELQEFRTQAPNASSAVSGSSTSDQAPTDTVLQVKDALMQMKKAGFTKGAVVRHKQKGYTCVIEEMHSDGAMLVSARLDSDSAFAGRYSLEGLKAMWSISKEKVQVRVDFGSLLPDETLAWKDY